MPSIIPKAYFCNKCKSESKKKTCDCGGKCKPLPPYTVRFRWINENGIEEHKRLTGEPPWQTQSAAQRGYEEWIAAHPSAKKKTTAKTFEFLPLYEEYKANLLATVKESSYVAYLDRIEKFVIPVFGNRNVTEISVADIIQWQNALTEKGYAYKYKVAIRSSFNHFFSYLKIYGINNPISRVKGFKKNAEARKEMLFWTETEFLQFISCVDDFRYKTVFSFLYLTGCRRGEALALRWKDIDFENKLVDIHATLTKISDKTRKQSEGEKVTDVYRITTPKTENSYRKILLPITLIENLKKLKEQSSSPFIFGSNNTILSFSTLEHAFKRYIKQSGVKSIRIHDLRHSHVSLLINKGENQLATIYVIAARLGDSVEMVFKTYGHMFPSSQKDIIDRLNFDF